MPPLYFCMGLDFTLRNNLSKPLWRGIPLLTLSLIVRFLHVIGQPPMPTDSACPILPHYRTTSKTISLRLSDSSTLSDNQQCQLTPLVRFFRIIGQPLKQTYSTCPIPPRYRTTSKTNVLRLSDSSALSDNPGSSIFQRNLLNKFGHVLEGVATILQGFIDFA